MAIRATIRYRGLLARDLEPGGFGRVFAHAVRMAAKEAGELWQKKMLPLHFGARGAASRYGYAKRTINYTRKKRRIYGHGRPLEYTGESKRDILGNPRGVQVRSDKNSDDIIVRVPIQAPKHFWQINPRGQQIDKGKELTSTTDEELRTLIDYIDQRVGVHLDALSAGARRGRSVA